LSCAGRVRLVVATLISFEMAVLSRRFIERVCRPARRPWPTALRYALSSPSCSLEEIGWAGAGSGRNPLALGSKAHAMLWGETKLDLELRGQDTDPAGRCAGRR
jgi:hypothetical protein